MVKKIIFIIVAWMLCGLTSAYGWEAQNNKWAICFQACSYSHEQTVDEYCLEKYDVDSTKFETCQDAANWAQTKCEAYCDKLYDDKEVCK